MAGFKEIDTTGLLNIKPGDLEKVVKQYNDNTKIIDKRINSLENFANDLSDSLGKVVAKNIVITPKVAGYKRFLNNEGLPKFPKVTVENGKIKDLESGKFISADKFQGYIIGSNNFYTDEENKTSLAGVNGVYMETARYLNHFLRPEDQIDTSKAYRFTGSTRKRALADIQAAINKITDSKGDYKLKPIDLDPRGFWEAWEKFKDDYQSNVYRPGSSNKMEAVEVFARDIYLQSKAMRKDERGKYAKRQSPNEILQGLGYKNFSSYLQDLQDTGEIKNYIQVGDRPKPPKKKK